MLSKIQNELKVPKTQYNNFGKYYYRNAEDILEALKPILLKYEATLILTDDIILIGDRYYVKATAELIADKTYKVSAFAREEDVKKGMDSSQITGTASSYARKYALNALFLIDDVKDSDTTNTHDNKKATEKQLNYLKKLGYDKEVTFDEATQLIPALTKFKELTSGLSAEERKAFAKKNNFEKLSDLKLMDLEVLILGLENG